MPVAVRPQQRLARVAVARPFTVEQRCFQQARPLLTLGVENVVQVITVAAAAIAIAEQQAALHVFKEHRVGGPRFPFAGHRRNTLQGGDVQRCAASEVNEWINVHIAGKMQVSGAIYRHRQIIVRIKLGDMRVTFALR